MGLDAVELVLAVEEPFGMDLPDADAAKGSVAAALTMPAHPLLAAATAAPALGAVLALATAPLANRLDVTAGALAAEAVPALVTGDATGSVAWTRDAVAETCRKLIRDQLGIDQFSDDAEFIRDLGMD